jgi:hypothetical protein
MNRLRGCALDSAISFVALLFRVHDAGALINDYGRSWQHGAVIALIDTVGTDAFTAAMSNAAYPQSETASPELTQNVDTVNS